MVAYDSLYEGYSLDKSVCFQSVYFATVHIHKIVVKNLWRTEQLSDGIKKVA